MTDNQTAEILAHALASFKHLLDRRTTSISTNALAREIKRVYDKENAHVACVLNTLAAVPNTMLFIAR